MILRHRGEHGPGPEKLPQVTRRADIKAAFRVVPWASTLAQVSHHVRLTVIATLPHMVPSFLYLRRACVVTPYVD